MTDSGLPQYRQTADKILAMIASGQLASGFKVPDVAKDLAVPIWRARKAAEHLAEHGVIEPHQGSGYTVLITRDQARAEHIDGRPVREQVAELQRELADLRQRLGRIEASLATLTGKPRGGKREQATPAASSGRR